MQGRKPSQRRQTTSAGSVKHHTGKPGHANRSFSQQQHMEYVANLGVEDQQSMSNFGSGHHVVLHSASLDELLFESENAFEQDHAAGHAYFRVHQPPGQFSKQPAIPVPCGTASRRSTQGRREPLCATPPPTTRLHSLGARTSVPMSAALLPPQPQACACHALWHTTVRLTRASMQSQGQATESSISTCLRLKHGHLHAFSHTALPRTVHTRQCYRQHIASCRRLQPAPAERVVAAP